MPQFDSRLKGTQKISPKALEEVQIVERLGLEAGQTYKGKNKTDSDRTITRIILPVFVETKDTTIVERKVSREDGKYYIYNTPNAFGTHCTVNYLDEGTGEHSACLPSEFEVFMSGAKPKVKATKDKSVPEADVKMAIKSAADFKKSAESSGTRILNEIE